MAFGLIIIGDEILSGKRADKHFSRSVEQLAARGLQLGWAHYVGDDPALITATLARTLGTEDIVFSFGGIGATPDDHTRQCAAAALAVPLVLHPEAKLKIEERIADTAREAGIAPNYDAADNLHRLKMGEFPKGAQIIPNPYNKIPGFSVLNAGGIGAHHFVPGFPVMAGPMVEWVLDTHYAHLFHRNAWIEQAVMVYGSMESTLTPLMEAVEAEFGMIKVFSLPSVGDAGNRRHIELGVKGDPQQVPVAFARLTAGLDALGVGYVQQA
ncbi:MAG: molybdopterin-binding protein [Lacisediminimonas sp.]|nr:molybdopterin-binding protein [Lacisediminimonas sp.]